MKDYKSLQGDGKTSISQIKSPESWIATAGSLDTKIESWKRELLDTGKRNKMINYRETKRATLKILEPSAKELFNRLAFSDKALTFQKPINKDTDFRTYSMIALMETLSYSLNVQIGDIKTAGTIIEREKTLKNLRAKAKLAQEEQGTNILYLCYGFIYWRAQNTDSSPWLKAPLLLMPAALGLKSLNAPYTLSRYDDEIQVNPTLDYLFKTEYNIELPTFDLKNRSSFEEYLAEIEDLADKRGWKLTQEVSLGLLSFLKISMYHDLNNNRERMINHPVLRAMAGDVTALSDIPAAAENFNIDTVRPNEWHEVVDADSSQEEAILLSKLGVSFVMQGPPGTGKSQTITNIIAEALADGKKVLFVSEKAAALEVVLKRLTEVQLNDFCLSLHNYKANKKEIIDSIGANLKLEPESTEHTDLNELSKLFQVREFLTKYASDLHRVIEPLDESVYTVFGKLSTLESATSISFQIDDIKTVTREQYSSLLYVLDALEKALHNLGGPLDSCFWRGTTARSSGQAFKQEIIRETDGLSEKLRELDGRIVEFNTEYQTVIGRTWEGAENGVADLDTALSLPVFPYWWSDIAKRETLIGSIHREAEAHRSLTASKRRYQTIFGDSVLEAPLDGWLSRTKDILDTYDSIGYGNENPGDAFLTTACKNMETVEELLSALGAYTVQYRALADRFGLVGIDSIQNARRVGTVLEFLGNRPGFYEKIWFTSTENNTALNLVDAAQVHAQRLSQARADLNTSWSESVLSLDLSDVRKTLFEGASWLFSGPAETESMANQVSIQLETAQALFDQATMLHDAQARATEVLGFEWADSLDGVRSAAAFLKQASEVPYLETAWFDVRRNEAVQPSLNEALGHAAKIKALTESVLDKWEPEALTMGDEALSMLVRFKTEYVGLLHRMKDGMPYLETIWFDIGKNGSTQTLLDDAHTHCAKIKELMDSILEKWEPEALNMEDEALEMLGRFKTEYVGVFHRMKSGYKKDIKRIRILSKEIGNTVDEAVVIAFLQSLKDLHDEKLWFADNEELLKELAGSYYHGENTDWETVKDGMIFAAEIANSFPHDKNPQDVISNYKADVNKIRLLSKEVGESIDEANVIALLQLLKDLRDEKQWYVDHQGLLLSLAGSYYHGADTDWESVKRGMTTASDLANSFPYANIPQDTICALQGAASSIQSAAEMKELASVLSEEHISDCEALLNAARFCSFSQKESSLGKQVIPEIQSFQEHCRAQQESIAELQRHRHSTGEIKGQELKELFKNTDQLRTEEAWFADHSKDLSALFANRNHGPESDFDGIRRGLLFAKDVLAFFSDSVPEKLVAELCSEADTRTAISDADQLTQNAVDGLSERIRLYAPFAFAEDSSVSEYVVPKVSEWLDATRKLVAFSNEIHPCLVADDIPLEQSITALSMVAEARDLRDRIIAQETGLAQQLGERYQGVHTDWEAIESDINIVSGYLQTYRAAVSREFLESVCDNQELRAKAGAALDALHAAYDKAIEPYRAFSKYFDENENLGAAELSALSERYEKCMDGFGELNKWLDYIEAKADCDAKGLGSFTAALVRENNSVSDVRATFERGFYQQWLSAVLDDVPAVKSFRRRVHEQRSDRFVLLDRKQYEIARKRIRESIIKSFPRTDGVIKAKSDLHILTHEMQKKKRIMPLRKLFQSIPNLLLTLKPCLMMSPLSVAYFLDADAYQFDMVIFDEASQIFPQDAIGAIFRAKQVIIAGDTKQLPPTNFFAASTSNSSEGYDTGEGYDEEFYDSILEETASILPNRTLLWHYRSRHEQLIAFSNQEIYRNNLVTFPSSNESEPDTGVEFVYVPEGYYEPSPKNYNKVEAQRCVQLVREHIEKHPDRSLGIIAFSEKQQQAIALEIQRFREKNPEYEAFFEEGKDDEFLVKNLENVQGDERDTIFFSIGYAKTKEQRANGKPMAMRFGPLGIQGGERRLNVAITRAKVNVKLVSSILPSDIDLNKTKSEGVRMLRAYIEFAMNGEATLSAAHKAGRVDEFADSIAKFIRDHGYKVRQYVGCSGYKIDIAVQHPSDLIEQFAAGIECDGFSYASAKTARDRDRLRGSVLKGMGWNLYRVWSSEWYKNPEIEGKKLLEFIEKAIAECDATVKALEEEKRRIEEAERIKIEKARAAREAVERQKQKERDEIEAKRQEGLREIERRRRENAQRMVAVHADNGKQEEMRREAVERNRKTSDTERPEWLKAGCPVFHKVFGQGTISSVNNNHFDVSFEDETKTFVYPKAFDSGFLTRGDGKSKLSAPMQRQMEIPQFHGAIVQPNRGSFIRDLKSAGFKIVDNRLTSSIVWVFYDSEKTKLFEQIAAIHKVRYSLEKRGAVATQNTPAWRVMIG